VTKADIQAGMPLDGTTAPFVIDAAGRYEATGQVPERLIGQIRPGMTVRLGQNTGSLDAGAVRGTVTAVGNAIDPATRSAMLKAQLPASPGLVAGRVDTITVWGPATTSAPAPIPAPGRTGPSPFPRPRSPRWAPMTWSSWPTRAAMSGASSTGWVPPTGRSS
jgi:hypothetical protein